MEVTYFLTSQVVCQRISY